MWRESLLKYSCNIVLYSISSSISRQKQKLPEQINDGDAINNYIRRYCSAPNWAGNREKKNTTKKIIQNSWKVNSD